MDFIRQIILLCYTAIYNHEIFKFTKTILYGKKINVFILIILKYNHCSKSNMHYFLIAITILITIASSYNNINVASWHKYTQSLMMEVFHFVLTVACMYERTEVSTVSTKFQLLHILSTPLCVWGGGVA